MSGQGASARRDVDAGQAGHGFWLLLACCLALVVILVLFALAVI